MKSREVSFPLGGIGSGCISIDGTGRLVDWEIFGKPNKESYNGFTHFAIKVEDEDGLVDARLIQGDYEGALTGQYTDQYDFEGFGWGVGRGKLAGVPHFKDVDFHGRYPMANLQYRDEHFPGEIDLITFNPFIPLNDYDSSLPGAFFEFEIANTTKKQLTYTMASVVQNPLMKGTVNKIIHEDNITGIHMGSDSITKDEREYGEFIVATDAKQTDYQPYWYRGIWYENLRIYWRDFTGNQELPKREYTSGNTKDTCVLTSTVVLNPGEKKKVRYLMTWYMPNCSATWVDGCNDIWKHYYAKMFDSARELMHYEFKHWNRLYEETKCFEKSLYESTMPDEVLDAVGANLSILKSPTVLRMQDGSFYGFEGTGRTEGSCEGSCTHVWNYTYALPYLFPSLERSMRDMALSQNMDEHGGLAFRTFVPFSRGKSTFRPCVDGQFGEVIKIYREWKISGNTDWLVSCWDKIKKIISYAWSEGNRDLWDPNKTGVITGRQHHTLDTELYGANSWLTGYYLLALKAGSEIAAIVGDDETAAEYKAIFSHGRDWVKANLFNGEYFIQQINLDDKSILSKYEIVESELIVGIGDKQGEAYWFGEAEELKYQYGEGCLIDQVIGAWHGNLNGINDIFDKEQTKSTLESIYRYNFIPSMREFNNLARIYSLNDEGGTVVCTWPEGKHEPVIPMLHTGETMSGFEYQVACHMIQEGMEEEGLEMIRAVRNRHLGHNRNPWNEFECGSNYARAMASYALLITYSGFSCNMAQGLLAFDPIKKDNECKFFWSVGTAWGTVECAGNQIILHILYGELILNKISFWGTKIQEVLLHGQLVDFGMDHGVCIFNSPLKLIKGERIVAN